MTDRFAEILAELKEIVSEDAHSFFDLSMESSVTVHAKLATRIAELENELNAENDEGVSAIVRIAGSMARIMQQSQRITDAFNSGDSDLPDIDPGSNAQLSRFLAAVRAANDEIHREVEQHLSD